MSTYKILLVDDDFDFRQEFAAKLKADGFEVTEAESGKQGGELFADKAYDLAIVDVRMERPDSGFSLAFHMKQAKADFPIIMVSSVNNEPGFHFSVNSNAERDWIKADIFLEKPVRYEQIKFAIDRLLLNK